MGSSPTSIELGAEVDAIEAGEGTGEDNEELQRDWKFTMKGSLRAPFRLSFGPRNDQSPGTEWHAPPHIVGNNSGDWNYIGLAPNPTSSIYMVYNTPRVAATVVYSFNNFADASYPYMNNVGGIAQAFLTLKFPDVFGNRGGLIWNVGDFSNRYGTQGYGMRSSGYYGAYLFGRTHVVGEDLTASIDLTDKWELILEHGLGTKLEVLPTTLALSPEMRTATGNYNPTWNSVPYAKYLVSQPHTVYGSQYLHHAHVGLWFDEWLRFSAHYIEAWSPNDSALNGYMPLNMELARTHPKPDLKIMGAEVHIDSETKGNGYIGYAHLNATEIRGLMDQIQTIHGGKGWDLKSNYFGDKDSEDGTQVPNDSGTIDTVLFQYMVRLVPLMGWGQPFKGRDLMLAVYGMYNYVHSPKWRSDYVPGAIDIKLHKLKVGSDVQLALYKWLVVGCRYDYVKPDLSTDAGQFSAISPRITFHTNWKTKEYIVLNYTHYFLGPQAYPVLSASALSDKPAVARLADGDMVSLTALMSF